MSNNYWLTDLRCVDNQLTTLDLSYNPKLRMLNCAGNQLTSINLQGNTDLKDISCQENRITGENMDLLITALPNVTGGTFMAMSTGSEEQNRMTKAQVAAAKAKGWTPKYSYGGLIVGE